jgi:hypothetical protein
LSKRIFVENTRPSLTIETPPTWRVIRVNADGDILPHAEESSHEIIICFPASWFLASEEVVITGFVGDWSVFVMSTGYRKSFATLAFVAFVSAPSLGVSPQVNAASAGACVRALLPQPMFSVEAPNFPSEVILAPSSTASYGWVAGQLVHPDHALCLARESASALGVAFRACDENDRMQFWQWKAASGATSNAGGLSVLQHQFTGHVLERMHVVKGGDALGVAEYQVGSDAQRFSIRPCSV